MTSPLPAATPLPSARPRRSIARAALAAAAALVLLLAGLLALLLIGVEVGPVALLTGLVLAALPVPIYVALALLIDRFEPEPPRLLLWAFFWGATGATLIALVVNSVGQAAVGGAFGSAVGELYGASISAPLVEEIAKGLVLFAIYRWRRAEFDGVLDGIVYAAMVGLGFAVTENILYYGRTALEGGAPLAATFLVRGVLSPFAHPLFTGLTGVGFGIAALGAGVAGRVAPFVGLFAAMALHSVWNTSAGVGGGLGFLTVYGVVMVPAFAAVVAIAIASLVREGRVVRHYLTPELAGGLLTEADVATLSSLRERRRALRTARRHGGAGARRAQRELHRTATELAFARRRAERRPSRHAATAAQEEAALVARLRAVRAAPPVSVGPAAATAASAPVEGGRSPQAPPAWYLDPLGQARLRWWDGARWTEHTAA